MASNTKSKWIGQPAQESKETLKAEETVGPASQENEVEQGVEETTDGHVEKKPCKNGVTGGGSSGSGGSSGAGGSAGPSGGQQTPTSSTGSTTNGSKIQTVFIHKLYDMLEDSSISHLIWWSSNNESFYLLPGEEFSKVLSQYFKHTNIASFIRQLNMYGFHKVNDTFPGSEESQGSNYSKWEFKHSTNQFRKGDIESLKLIKRRSSKNVNSHKEIVNLKSIPTSHPVGVEDEQSSDPQKQYHESLQKQQYHQQSHKTGDLSQPSTPQPPAVPPQHLSQSPMSHGKSSLSHPPPLASRSSFENSVNFKFIEMNNNYQTLKNDFNNLAQRYDFVAGELHKTQTDILQLIDVLERNHTTTQPNASEGGEHAQDRAPSAHNVHEDANHSPHKSIGGTLENNLAVIRANLLNRINNPAHFHPPPQVQQYHLNSHHPSLTGNVNPNNPNIVPQHYPLNPYYTIYSQEPPLRQLSVEESQGHSNRNLSVLVDPLQHPIPSRHNSRVQQDDVYRQRAESKSYSPLSVSGYSGNQHQPPVQFQSSASTPVQSSMGNIEKTNLSRNSSFTNHIPPDQARNFHQYPFPLMTGNEQPGQNNPISRNSSMLNFAADPGTPEIHKLAHVHSSDNILNQYQPALGPQPPMGQHQLNHPHMHRNSSVQSQSQSQSQQQQQSQPQSAQSAQCVKSSNHPPSSNNNSNVSTPSTYPPRSVPENSNSSNSVFTVSSSSETVPTISSTVQATKNQLPSVSELDKSIKVGNSNVVNLFNNVPENSSKSEKSQTDDV